MSGLNRPTLETIYSRIKTDLETRLTKKKGKTIIVKKYSLLGILASVFAGSIHLCYGVLVWLAEQFFVDTAEYAFLLLLGIPKGIYPLAATYATGVVKVYGLEGVTFPAYQTFQDDNNNSYTATDDYATIFDASGEILVNIKSDTIGIDFNISGELTLMQPIADINDIVEIQDSLLGGTDKETTEQYRARLKQFMQSRPEGGKASDYVRWALSVSGVGFAWCVPTIVGAGSVGVVLSSATNEAVDATIIENVYNKILTVYPLGVVLKVYSIIPVLISYEIAISPNTEAYQTAIKTNLEKVFSNAVPKEPIKISAQREAVSSSGVSDYKILAIYKDGVAVTVDDIAIVGFERATLSAVVWSLKV